MFNRRHLLGAGAALVSTSAWAQTSNMGLPEAAVMENAATQPQPRVFKGSKGCLGPLMRA